MKHTTAETKVQTIIRRAGKPIQASQIIKAMNWGYAADAARVIQDMANSGQITRTWDDQGNAYYSK